jgi:hypothetical protein
VPLWGNFVCSTIWLEKLTKKMVQSGEIKNEKENHLLDFTYCSCICQFDHARRRVGRRRSRLIIAIKKMAANLAAIFI